MALQAYAGDFNLALCIQLKNGVKVVVTEPLKLRNSSWEVYTPATNAVSSRLWDRAGKTGLTPHMAIVYGCLPTQTKIPLSAAGFAQLAASSFQGMEQLQVRSLYGKQAVISDPTTRSGGVARYFAEVADPRTFKHQQRLVTEYVPGGSFFQLLAETTKPTWKKTPAFDTKLVTILLQLCIHVQMTSDVYRHQDMTVKNVLIGDWSPWVRSQMPTVAYTMPGKTPLLKLQTAIRVVLIDHELAVEINANTDDDVRFVDKELFVARISNDKNVNAAALKSLYTVTKKRCKLADFVKLLAVFSAFPLKNMLKNTEKDYVKRLTAAIRYCDQARECKMPKLSTYDSAAADTIFEQLFDSLIDEAKELKVVVNTAEDLTFGTDVSTRTPPIIKSLGIRLVACTSDLYTAEDVETREEKMEDTRAETREEPTAKKMEDSETRETRAEIPIGRSSGGGGGGSSGGGGENDVFADDKVYRRMSKYACPPGVFNKAKGLMNADPADAFD